MVIGPNFVFLHAPKTGGMWMQKAFEVGGVSTRLWHKHSSHYPLGYLPKNLEHLRSFILVRNPWEWYVSHLEFVRQKRIPDLSWNFSHKQYMLLFRSIRACVAEMPSLQYELESLTEHPRVQTTVLRFEDGLIPAYEQITGAPAPGPVKSLAPQNVSPHPHYREYYDETTQAMVAEKNAELIEKYNYLF